VKQNSALILIFILSFRCSPKIQQPDPEALKPIWLKSQSYQDGYYTGVGHSTKDGSNNYIQEAKKSALEDLVSEIKVNVSSTSVLSQLEVDKKLKEKYEQVIRTTATDEIEEFEMVDAYEDGNNYWVYYRLSIARYRQIKEEQKRNAVLLGTDYYKKGKLAEKSGDRLQAVSFYFQALRSLEKYLGDAIEATIDGENVFLVNEVYASIQTIFDHVSIQIEPATLTINRRVNLNAQNITAKAVYKDINKPASQLSLLAVFAKGGGNVFPTYKTDERGKAKILINKITSREFDQSLIVKVDIDQLSGAAGNTPIYGMVVKTLNVPSTQIDMKVQRPIVYLTADEKSFGLVRPSAQISSKLKNILANEGFEFSDNRQLADLWFDVTADAERGSVAGSIFITYLTGRIKVTALKEGREIYATTLDRIKGYGLDYEKSSVDAYTKAMETLERERMTELLNTVLQ
jgi:hypothetical protein